MSQAAYAVRLYEPELADACARFIQRTWPTEAGAVPEAGVAPPRVLFLKGREVIGHVATTPVRLAVAGELLDASWAVGLVVVPEHRNGPVAPLLVKKLNDTVAIGLTLHVEDAALRVFKGVGWHHLGVIPQYVRVLDSRAFLRSFARRGGRFLAGRPARLWSALSRASWLVAPLVGLAFASHAMAGALRRRGAGRMDVTDESTFDASYTELAQRVKSRFGVWVLRDEPYLTARYVPRMPAYRLLACRRQGRLLGWGIVKIRQFVDDERMGDIRMGTLVDCVFDPDEPAVLDALLDAAVAVGRREGVDVLFCSASLRMLGRRLRQHGFVAIPGTLNAAFHDRTGRLADNPPLESWHLMRGDSDADANC